MDKAVLITIVCMILLIGIVGIVNSDSKIYDSKNKEIKIKDISNKELATFTLLYNTNHCGGDQICYAIMEANIKQSKKDVFSKLKFDKIKGKGDITNLKIEYTNPNGDWIAYDSNLEYNGKFKIKISGYKLPEDSVDWVPTLYNLDISEWAVWGTQLTYDDFNDGIINWSLWRNESATNGQQTETGGKFKLYVASALCSGCSQANTIYSTNLTPLNSIENITISIKLFAQSNSCCSGANLYFGGTEIKSVTSNAGSATNDSVWTIIRNQTSAGKFETYANGVWIAQITPTTNVLSSWASCDNQGGDNAYTETDYVYYTIYNGSLIITLNTPLDDANQFSLELNSMTFNITSNATVNNLKNITLYLNDVSNGTQTISGTINNTIITRDFSSLGIGEHNWSVYVCDDSSNCRFSDLRQFIISPFKENSQTYNTTTYEMKSESFILNLTYDNVSWSGITASLIYNGTSYSGTKSGTGSSAIFTRSIDVPLLTSGIASNYSFYWNVSLTNSTSTVSYVSTTYNQSVTPITLGFCNGTYTIPYVNFTFKDEATDSYITAFIDSSTWVYHIGNGILTKTFIFSNTSRVNPSYAFCLNPEAASNPIIVDLSFLKYSNTTYPQRTYSNPSWTLTNTTTNQILYLLSSTTGIYSSFMVVDPSRVILSDVTITVERQVNNVWTTIGQVVTGSDGVATFWVNPNFAHRISAVRTGYVSTQFTITPSQSLYTITMSKLSGNETYVSEIPGIIYTAEPAVGPIKYGSTNFNVTVTSSENNLVNCRFQLLNATNNSQIFATTTGFTNSSYCFMTLTYTVAQSSKIFGRISLITTATDGAYVIVDTDLKWISMNTTVNSWRTITSLFSDFNSLSEFGEGNEGEFSRVMTFFIIVTIFIGVFIFFTGIELINPGLSILIIAGIVFIGSMGGFLTWNSGRYEVNWIVKQFGFAFLFLETAALYLLTQYRRSTE